MTSLRAARTLLCGLAVVALVLLPVAVLAPTTAAVGPFGVQLDVVRGLLAVLVCGIGAVVAAYAARNLTGQHRLARFAALEVASVVALSAAVLAPSTLQLALGWTLGGIAVAGLVGHAGTPDALRAMRSVRARLLLGDLALWAAVALLAARTGTTSIADLGDALVAQPAWVVTIAALLVVIAGAARSALVPAHRWLPETAAAPSPVSALLHAGLVNGVGVVSLVLWPVVMASLAARGVLLVLGVVTALAGTAWVRTRPDVKGRLAASTSAQMGYLGIQVALGIPAAVLAHLVGHGCWKAAQFLGAGGALERRPLRGSALSPRARLVGSLGAAALLVAASIAPVGLPSLLSGPAGLVPLGLALAAVLAAVAGLTATSSRAAGAAYAVTVSAGAVYLLALRGLGVPVDAVLAPSTPLWGEPGALAVTVLVVALALVAVLAVRFDRRVRAGARPELVERIAAGSLPPVPVRDLAARREVRPGVDHIATALRGSGTTSRQVAAASAAVAPVFPLHSFVAASPLAGLTGLEMRDALAVAATSWDAEVGPDGATLASQLERGAVSLDDVRDVAVQAGLLDDVSTSGELDEVLALLTSDDSSSSAAVAADEPADDVLALLVAREYGDPSWPTPQCGVWAALRASASLDRRVRVRGAERLVRGLPADPVVAVDVLLALHGVDDADRVPVLTRVIARDPGWPSHLAWRLRAGLAIPGASAEATAAGAALADLVAARLAVDLIVGRDVRPPARPSTTDLVVTASGVDARVAAHGVATLRAEVLDHAHHRRLLGGIGASSQRLADGVLTAPAASGGPDAQVVTCIDVRSERLRRHLERTGPWETFGAAGFFGLPVAHRAVDGVLTDRCPVLLAPAGVVTESAPRDAGVHGSLDSSCAGLRTVESRPLLPFSLAEAAGWVTGPWAALRTLAPRTAARASGSTRSHLAAAGHGWLVVDGPDGLDLDALVDLAFGFVRSTGLEPTAPVVLLCGHGGAAANNPHRAAYDCGACGGQAGDVSARSMAQVLNDPRVRAALRERGVDIPDTTYVAAAVHDTTRDRVLLLDIDAAPAAARAVLDRLVDALDVACDIVVHERAAMLPDMRPVDDITGLRRQLDARGVDWAQPRPEWGLAGNEAIVIGPRALTSSLRLDGRVFLQSYRADLDVDGALLEQLVAGPLVVAQWINAQYWFSTVDPDRFGAGDKTTHNVLVGGRGMQHPLSAVITGARGDVRIGLPWQAVSRTAPVDGRWRKAPEHVPVRLLAVVCASTSTMDAVLARQPHVHGLALGGWISLAVVDPVDGVVRRLDASGCWVPTAEVIDLEAMRQSSLVAD